METFTHITTTVAVIQTSFFKDSLNTYSLFIYFKSNKFFKPCIVVQYIPFFFLYSFVIKVLFVIFVMFYTYPYVCSRTIAVKRKKHKKHKKKKKKKGTDYIL